MYHVQKLQFWAQRSEEPQNHIYPENVAYQRPHQKKQDISAPSYTKFLSSKVLRPVSVAYPNGSFHKGHKNVHLITCGL